MSAIEKARKIAGNEGARTPPRFASHTQSSLMKKRTPISLRRKLSSTVKERESRSGIFKRRSGHGRSQSRSVVALKMILDQRHRATRSFSGCVLTETARQTKQYAENLLVSLQDDLIKDISWSIKCARSPIKLVSRIVSRSETRAGDPNEDSLDVTCAVSSVSFQEELDSKSTSQDSTVADTASKSPSGEEDVQEESAKSRCEENDVISKINVFRHERENDREPQALTECETRTLQNDNIQVLHQRSHRRSKETDESLNKNNNETQVCQPTAVNRTKYTHKVWKKRKAKTQTEEADVVNGKPRDSANPKIVKQIDSRDTDTRAIANNDAKYARKKGGQRNFSFIYRRAWRPAGIGGKYPNVENTESSTQLASQKSQFRSTVKSGASIKNKHSPVEQVESFDSESTNAPMSASQSKENRDPRDRATKTSCEQAAESKEQHGQQRKAMQKQKRWATRKIDSGNEAGSRSRWQHWRSFTPRSPNESNEQQQSCVLSEPAGIGGRRSRPAEVIHALKEIIDSVSDDPEENVASASKTGVFRENETNPEIPTRNDDGPRFAATEDRTIRRSFEQLSSWRTIGTQTELNFLSNLIDSGRILKLQTQTVATQTTPPCGGENIVEIGCNTMSHGVNTCRDAEVSCDLIGFSNVKTELSAIEEESPSENTAMRAMRSPPRVTRIYDSDNDAVLGSDSSRDESNDEERGAEKVPSDTVIENIKTIYELAAGHARNLHEAVVIYYENLMSREKQHEEIRGGDETFWTTYRGRDRCPRLEISASLTSSASVDEIESEHGDGERLVTDGGGDDDDDLDGFSVCSTTSSSERTFVSVIRNSKADVADLGEFDRAEGSENAQVARSNLNVPVDLEGMRSMMRLLMRRAQEERVFEILRSGGNDEESLAMAEKPPIVSRENLFPLVCCALCILVFWCLPLSFQCQTDA